MAEKNKTINTTSYHSKLVGVNFEGRQDIIAELKGDEPLRFRREPENEHDQNAVAVDVLVQKVVQGHADNTDITVEEEWKPIGYIARDKNSELAEVLSDGKFASIKIKDITGGEWNQKQEKNSSYGVNVFIEYEKKLKETRSRDAKLVKDFFGNEIFYDEILHEYTDALGYIYLSGSAYAKQGEAEFDADYWAKDAIARHNLDERLVPHVKAMWETNGDASRSFGTAIHAAIELFGKYHRLASKIDTDLKTGKRKMLSAKVEKNSALSKLPYLKKVVNAFFTPERLAETAHYEVLVVDHANKRAGRIDRLVVLEDGSYEVRDMKTNNKMSASDKREYTKQLSFYGDLILANGKKLGDNPTMIHHWHENKKGEEVWEDISLVKMDTLAK